MNRRSNIDNSGLIQLMYTKKHSGSSLAVPMEWSQHGAYDIEAINESKAPSTKLSAPQRDSEVRTTTPMGILV